MSTGETGTPLPDGGQSGWAAEATTGSSVMRGGLWYALTLLVPQVYTLVISIAAARYLGDDLFGRQSFIAFVALSTGMLVSGGLPYALSRYVGEGVGRGLEAQVRGLIRLGWRILIVCSAAGTGILVGVALAGADPQAAWLFAAAALLMSVLHHVPSAALAGLQRWRQASMVGLTTGAASTIAVVFVLEAGYGISGMFAVEAAVGAVNLVWTGALARSSLRRMTPDVARPHDLARPAIRYALFTSIGVLISFVVWRRSELFFLERYSTDAQIALYSIPFAMVAALGMLTAAVSGVLSTAVATLFGAGQRERIRSGYSRSMRLVVLGTFPLLAGGLALGPSLLRLVYGSEYADAGDILLILLLGLPFIAAMQVSTGILTGIGDIVMPTILGFTAGVVNIGLDVALIPDGEAVGAAWANLGAQLTGSLLIAVYTVRRMGGVSLDFRSLGAAALASGAGGIVAWAVDRALGEWGGFVLGLAGGVATFAAVAALARILPAADASWLVAATGRRRLGSLIARLCRLWAPRGTADKP